MNSTNFQRHSFKTRAINGILWSAIDRLSQQGALLFFNIILARLLMPEDFGVIGMLSIFIVISQSFVDSGMGAGLIQKNNRSEIDFSTVFVFNFCVSIVIYIILFFLSPLIADFFNRHELIIITRVLGLNIIINSLAIVQRSILTIELNFKKFSKVNLISLIISGICAVYFAKLGYGVWALVIQNLVMSTVSVLLFWLNSTWGFSIKFSLRSFKQLFSFGSNLLIAGLYSTSLNEVYNVTIGKYYSAQLLGYYTNAKKISDITSDMVSSILLQVTFPILATLQNDKERLVEIYKRLIRTTTFLILPLMTLIALLADPIIRLLLTDKWESSIPLLQLLCFARIVTPISVVNLNILKAIGRSDLFLKVDLVKFPFIITILIFTIPFGLTAILIGSVFTSVIAFFINTYIPGKLYGYGAFEQLKDMFPVFLSTIFMAITVFFITYFIDNNILKLLFGGITGLFSYLTLSYLLKINELDEFILLFKDVNRKKKP